MASTEPQEPVPFSFLNLPFASRQVLLEFTIVSLLIILIPIFMVVFIQSIITNRQDLTELQKVAWTVGPVLVFINIVIGVYIYRTVKDPANYVKDAPIKPLKTE